MLADGSCLALASMTAARSVHWSPLWLAFESQWLFPGFASGASEKELMVNPMACAGSAIAMRVAIMSAASNAADSRFFIDSLQTFRHRSTLDHLTGSASPDPESPHA